MSAMPIWICCEFGEVEFTRATNFTRWPMSWEFWSGRIWCSHAQCIQHIRRFWSKPYLFWLFALCAKVHIVKNLFRFVIFICDMIIFVFLVHNPNTGKCMSSIKYVKTVYSTEFILNSHYVHYFIFCLKKHTFFTMRNSYLIRQNYFSLIRIIFKCLWQ